MHAHVDGYTQWFKGFGVEQKNQKDFGDHLELAFIGYLWTGCRVSSPFGSSHFTVMSFIVVATTAPFYRWGSWSSKRWNYSFKLTQLFVLYRPQARVWPTPSQVCIRAAKALGFLDVRPWRWQNCPQSWTWCGFCENKEVDALGPEVSRWAHTPAMGYLLFLLWTNYV
jgi:hypothetical protein